LRLFQAAKCKCIVLDTQRDTANLKEIAWLQLLRGLAKLRKIQKDEIATCTCEYHQHYSQYKEIHKSISTFTAYILCPQDKIKDLAIPSAIRSRTPGEATALNVTAAQKKMKNKKTATITEKVSRKRPSTTGVSSSTKRVTLSDRLAGHGASTGTFNIHNKDCCYHNCKECGVAARLVRHKCPLEWTDQLSVTVRVYSKLPRSGKYWHIYLYLILYLFMHMYMCIDVYCTCIHVSEFNKINNNNTNLHIFQLRKS
jgi:hypothetical protein